MEIIEIVNESSTELNSKKEEFNINSFDVNEFISKAKDKLLTEDFYTIPFFSDNIFNWRSYKRIWGMSFKTRPISNKIEKLIENLATFQLEEIKNKYTNVAIYSVEQARVKFPLTKNLSVGTYTKHPKNSSIITPIENFYSTLKDEKDHELIEIFGKLGAKELIIEDYDYTSTESSTSIKTDIGVAAGNISADVENKTEKGKITKAEYSGNSVDIDDNLLDKSIWFRDDPQINSLFESRKFKQNAILKYTYTSKYDRNFGLNIEVAIKYLKSNCDLKSDYEKTSKVTRKFNVIFGE